MNLQQMAAEQRTDPGSLAAFAVDASWAALAVRDALYGGGESDSAVLASFRRCYEQLSWLRDQPRADVVDIASAEVVVNNPYEPAQQVALTMSRGMSLVDELGRRTQSWNQDLQWWVQLGEALESIGMSETGEPVIKQADKAEASAQYLDSLSDYMTWQMLELQSRAEALDYAIA